MKKHLLKSAAVAAAVTLSSGAAHASSDLDDYATSVDEISRAYQYNYRPSPEGQGIEWCDATFYTYPELVWSISWQAEPGLDTSDLEVVIRRSIDGGKKHHRNRVDFDQPISIVDTPRPDQLEHVQYYVEIKRGNQQHDLPVKCIGDTAERR